MLSEEEKKRLGARIREELKKLSKQQYQIGKKIEWIDILIGHKNLERKILQDRYDEIGRQIESIQIHLKGAKL